ncbi:wall-associated receptor kinase-like 2 [Bidens hawaiensis]|uniref:wall-associated receptor kinase-like 2 n=1 Tax=Bidens hawaiensis TaxID=980011 RepID=UPI004049E81E
MKLFLALHLLVLLSITTSPAISKYAKTGCKDTCGNNVKIPYPFGIGAECSVNTWYIVDCKYSKPYLPALDHKEILGVNLRNQTITVSMPINVSTRRFSYCQNPVRNSSEIMGVDMNSSPFWFSKSHNKFVFEGCGTAAMIDNGSVLTGCSTTCRNATHSGRSNCFGIGCCETTIPHLLKSYTIKVTGFEEAEAGACGSAFLMEDETFYEERRFSDPLVVGRSTPSIAVSLMWILTESDQVTCCFDRIPVRNTVDNFNGTGVDTWTCFGYWSEGTGSPYLKDGCVSPCIDSGGKCERLTVLDVDGFLFSQNFNCIQGEGRTSLGIILGVSISIGVFFVVGISYVLYKVIKKTKERRRRKRFFKRNGGLLLKQQEEADPSLVDKTIHFSSRELQKATDNFNENRIVGRGGQGTVYKGMLVDGRIVAVKKSKIVDESQLQQFINEVVVLSQINHRNVVKLLGCCLETDVPLLVSEFIPNGTLYDRLHNETHEFPISLDMRLQIATEVAGAVAYLHSATSIPIYHRDIKTTNILLDDKNRAKVSDFGTSRFVTIDQTHLTTLVKGTFGYLDPEYFQSSQFTEKSDVYSFGVVLVELLTGEKPISLTRFGENRSLATYFMLAMEEGRVMSIFDATVLKEGTRDELLSAANLAMRCLNLNGKFRPTMKEVATELDTIRRSHIPSTVQTNAGFVVYGEELSMQTYGESSSTVLSFNDSFSL